MEEMQCVYVTYLQLLALQPLSSHNIVFAQAYSVECNGKAAAHRPAASSLADPSPTLSPHANWSREGWNNIGAGKHWGGGRLAQTTSQVLKYFAPFSSSSLPFLTDFIQSPNPPFHFTKPTPPNTVKMSAIVEEPDGSNEPVKVLITLHEGVSTYNQQHV